MISAGQKLRTESRMTCPALIAGYHKIEQCSSHRKSRDGSLFVQGSSTAGGQCRIGAEVAGFSRGGFLGGPARRGHGNGSKCYT